MQPAILDKPHTHAGVKHLAGATIEVEPHVYEWLLANKVIGGTEPSTTEPAPEPEATEQTEQPASKKQKTKE